MAEQKQQEPKSLDELCDRIGEADAEPDGDEERITFRAVIDVVGRRSFGPLLLVSGLGASAPVIGDIPGVPTATGIMVVVIAAQLLLGRQCFWLPEWMLKRSVTREKLCKALEWMRPVARFIDRLTRPRLQMLTHGPVIYVIATVCVAIAFAMPAMELVPFSAQLAGAALTLFGVSMIAHDGLVALFAFAFTVSTFAVVGYGLLT
ncbi:MAG TPA: exopolysaccharide biosynthesis protein [Candidatus Limnocylindrales bacterium]|nr:exopolysaccharide biosynthesis protein [Candidatus Limnocylindrales bacterium]